MLKLKLPVKSPCLNLNSISTRLHGSSPYSVALVHGGPGAAGDLHQLAKLLSDKSGILELIQTRDTIDDLIQEMDEQIRIHASRPLVLVGHSWGAWLALLYAAEADFDVAKVIIIGAAPFEDKYSTGIMAERLSRMSQSERDEAESILRKLEANAGSNADLSRLSELLQSADVFDPIGESGELVEVNEHIFQTVWREASALRTSGELLTRIRKVSCPVVAFHGDYDPHPPEGVFQPLTDTLVNFRLTRLKNCGHKPWLERTVRESFLKLLQAEIVV